MRKEIAAAVILMLMFAGVLINIRANEHILDGLMSEVGSAYKLAVEGDFPASEESMRTAIAHWQSYDSYTHIFIRHSEINSATEAFYNMLGDISSEDEKSLSGSYGLLSAQLKSMITMERISLGSIF